MEPQTIRNLIKAEISAALARTMASDGTVREREKDAEFAFHRLTMEDLKQSEDLYNRIRALERDPGTGPDQ